jgi:hypothetical protein
MPDRQYLIELIGDEEQADLFRRLAEEHNWLAIKEGGLPFPVQLSLGRSSDGRLVCTGLVIGAMDEPREITSRSLRELPLGDLLGSIARLRDDPDVGSFLRATFELADDIGETPRHRPGPRGYDREHFEHVAVVYREALAVAPRAPMQEVARRLSTSEATARRWVQRARDMSLLGAGQPGKAGEQTEGSTDGER